MTEGRSASDAYGVDTGDEAYALTPMAFPMPAGTTVWRCLKDDCPGPRDDRFYGAPEMAEAVAVEHLKSVHGVPR